MKRVLKKSLDELSKVMPIINESEQSSCVGGTFYFDAQGNYFGSKGSGDTIRVLNDYGVSNYIGLTAMGLDDSGSFMFYDRSLTTKNAILSNIGDALGSGTISGIYRNNAVFGSYNVPNITPATTDTTDWVTTINGVTTLNVNNPCLMSGNIFEIDLAMKYEYGVQLGATGEEIFRSLSVTPGFYATSENFQNKVSGNLL